MSFDRIARKIKRPPAAQNWVRLNVYGDVLATTKLIVKFALAIPPFNYMPAIKVCHEKVRLGLDLETAVKAVRRIGAPTGWDSNESFVRSFYEHDDSVMHLRDGYAESFLDGAFRVARDVVVPTKPSYTVRKSGLLMPYVLCGWRDVPFEDTDIRMFMTVLESGLFSYSDYRHSPAQVTMFPVIDGSRKLLTINRGDYTQLSASELRDQLALYVEAQIAALPLAEAMWHEREAKRRRGERSTTVDSIHVPRDPDFFER